MPTVFEKSLRPVQGGPYKVVFFGCSFMFGHGVEDDQTLPYYFVQEAKGTFEGFNFAGDGWGPHQMLREIETGFVRRVAGTPDLAIYEAIPDHLRRVAGRAPWEDGPKYDLCRGNEACYSGPFHSADYVTYRHWLDRSWIVKFFENSFRKAIATLRHPIIFGSTEEDSNFAGEKRNPFCSRPMGSE